MGEFATCWRTFAARLYFSVRLKHLRILSRCSEKHGSKEKMAGRLYFSLKARVPFSELFPIHVIRKRTALSKERWRMIELNNWNKYLLLDIITTKKLIFISICIICDFDKSIWFYDEAIKFGIRIKFIHHVLKRR